MVYRQLQSSSTVGNVENYNSNNVAKGNIDALVVENEGTGCLVEFSYRHVAFHYI